MTLRAALAIVLAVAAAAAGAQQIYRWTDEKGRVHVTDTPPPPSARGVQKKNSDAAANRSAGVSTQTPYELSMAMKNFPVTLYTSPTCNDPCANARTVLNRRGVPFKEVQVWDADSNAELKRISGSNEVPTLLVGRGIHVGFQHGAYEALLDSARYPRQGVLPARSQSAPAAPEGYAAPKPAEPVQPEPEESAPSGPCAPKPPSRGR